MSHPAAIEGEGICRRFGRRWALIEVGLRVERGEVFALTGRNGSGKSTLLRVLATALRPDRGRVLVDGLDVKLARDQVRAKVALLGHASNLYEPLTALENLTVVAGFLGSRVRQAALTEALERVGLTGRASDPVATFSAGMRKRLQLARLLIQDAPLLLLDEPFAALDPPGFRLVEALLQEQKARGATVVMATHLLDRARAMADSACVLSAGCVSWSGPAAKLPAEPGR